MNLLRQNVIAFLALFVALGGSGLAASRVLITSPSQLSPSVRAALKGKTGPQGKEGLSLIYGEPGLEGKAGKDGQPGRQGKEGHEGPQGRPGGNEVFLPLIHASATIPAHSTGGPDLKCPEGSKVISGSGNPNGQPVTADEAEYPGEHAWVYEVENKTAGPLPVEGTVRCVEP